MSTMADFEEFEFNVLLDDFEFYVRRFAEGDIDAVAGRLHEKALARAKSRADAVQRLREADHTGWGMVSRYAD